MADHFACGDIAVIELKAVDRYPHAVGNALDIPVLFIIPGTDDDHLLKTELDPC